MSATGRGSERNEEDFYETPAWCVRRLLEKVALPAGRWLEPGAGNGAIIAAVNEFRDDVQWMAVEKRPVLVPGWFLQPNYHLSWWRTDFLDESAGYVSALAGADGTGFKVALGNPPYTLAQAFADRCFMLAETTALLLRLNFLGSEERAEWWEKHPADVYVLPNRPSFCVKVKCPNCKTGATYPADTKTLPSLCLKCGAKNKITRTDATEYAWFVWGEGGTVGKRAPRHYHLALTPESERYNRAPKPIEEMYP